MSKTPKEQFVEDISHVLPALFDSDGQPVGEITMLISDPLRLYDLDMVFDRRPFLAATANKFVNGLVGKLEPFEVVAFLGFAMTASILAQIPPSSEDRAMLAMDLAAEATRIAWFAEQIIQPSQEKFDA